jgi:fatty-acyl-CoA synthase
MAGPTIQSMLTRAFRRYADRDCLVWESGTASFGETGERAGRLARWLDENVGEQRHVAIALPNGRAYLESILACTLAGAVRVPLSPREPIDTLRSKLDESDTEVVIATPEIVSELGDWLTGSGRAALSVADGEAVALDQVARQPARTIQAATESDRYRLSFTGGTTGSAKAVVQTHRQERAMIRNLLLETVRPGPRTTFVAATPLAHAAGAFVVPTVLSGGSVSWLGRFDPERLADSSWLGTDGAGRKVETFIVPTAMADLTSAARNRHDLATVVYGGAPCPDPVLSAAVDRLGSQALVQVYGQAEAPMTICVASRDDHRAGLVTDGWVGHPFMFVTVAVVGGPDPQPDVGELVVRAEHVMDGYWRRPEETAGCLDQDGTLHTGDVGRIEPDGSVRIIGRQREMIISGGFNVYPDDVERRLRLRGLADVPMSVFGLAHPRWGEAVAIAVACPPDTAASVAQRVREVAQDALSYYEQPKALFTVEDLPLTSVGKVARQDLASRFSAHFASARPLLTVPVDTDRDLPRLANGLAGLRFWWLDQSLS